VGSSVLLDPCWAHLGLCGPTLGQYGCPSDGISGHRVIDGVGGIGRKAFTILRCAMTGCALWLARRCCCCCCGWLRADTAKGCCCMRLSWCYACRGCLGCPACCLGWQVWPACCVVWPACCIAPAHFSGLHRATRTCGTRGMHQLPTSYGHVPRKALI
jgi:hypothetical protein